MAAELATTLTVSEAQRLEQAEGVVRDYCGWHIAPAREDVEVTVDGSGASLLPLPTLHLTEITSIVEDGVEVDLADVQWDQAGYLWRPTPWTWKFRSIVVTINHGHTPIPPAVQGVVQAVAQRAVGNPESKPRTQDGPFSDTNSQSGLNQAPTLQLLDEEKRILDRYRLPDLP